MSKFKTMVKKDITICDELIGNNFATQKDELCLVGKYIVDYPDFDKGLINYASVPGSQTNHVNNIYVIKSKLEYLLNRVDNPELYLHGEEKKSRKEGPSPIVITNTNVNTNNNSNGFNMTIDDIRNNINENTFLGDSEKEELLDKLDEIDKLQKSNESKTKKWDTAKSIFSFLLDKGADIAIMYIPQILAAISK